MASLGSKILGIFFNTDKLAEANRKYREQKARNEAHNAEVRFQIELAKERNRRDFHAALAANDAKRDKKIETIENKYGITLVKR